MAWCVCVWGVGGCVCVSAGASVHTHKIQMTIVSVIPQELTDYLGFFFFWLSVVCLFVFFFFFELGYFSKTWCS